MPSTPSSSPAARARDHSRLFLIGETAPVLEPIAFDNRSFLQFGSGWVELEGNRLTKKTEYSAGLDPTRSVVAGTGRFPERAWVAAGGGAQLFTWSNASWRQVDTTGAGNQPTSGDRIVALGRWGRRHLALHVGPVNSGSQVRSFFELLEGDTQAPEFAPPSDAAAGQHCGSQLVAEAGFSLSSGDFVAMGTLCGTGPARSALEYFAPGEPRGTPIELSAVTGQRVGLKSAAQSGASVYLAGSTVDGERPYLARFSPGTGIVELEVWPAVDPIERIAVSADGSVWVKAPRRDQKIDFDDAGLWRRSPDGNWQRLRLEPRVPGKPDWSINVCGYGLFSLAGDAWLQACYVRQGQGHEHDPSIDLLYRSRGTPG